MLKASGTVQLLNKCVIFRGNVVWMSEVYDIKLDWRKTEEETGAILEVITPSRDKFTVEMVIQIERQSDRVKLSSHIRYKNPQNKEYVLTNTLDIEKLSTPCPFSYKIETEFTFTPPEGRQTMLKIEAEHKKTSEERIVHLKVYRCILLIIEQQCNITSFVDSKFIS